MVGTLDRPKPLAEIVGAIPVDSMGKQELFEALTDGHEWSFLDPLGDTPESRHTPALLPLLRESVFGGMERSGGSPGFTSRLPIAAGALDLYETIDLEIAEAWACVFPGQIPSIDSPERLLSQLVAVSKPDELVSITVSTQRIDHQGTRFEHWWVERTTQETTVGALLKRWVRQIAELFDPPRTADIQHPCIACGEMWAWKYVSGEPVPYKVFVFIRDSHGNSREARCLNCHTSWGRDSFMWIAAQIGGDTEASIED